MVQHSFMIDLTLDMEGTNESTAVKFCQTTSSNIQII